MAHWQTATPSNQLAAQGADIVCVVVKPWLVEQVLKGIKDVLDYSGQLLIVVAAGVKSTDINTWLDKGGDTIPTFLVIHSQHRYRPLAEHDVHRP